MKKIVIAVALTLGSVGAQAQDWFHYEADLGATYFVAGRHGLYFQQAMPHYLHTLSPAGRIGVSADVIAPRGFIPGVSVNLSYLNFGRAEIGGDAAPDPTGQFAKSGGYNIKTNQCEGPCGPIRNFETGGSLQAIALTLEPYWTHGKWRFSVEGGAAVFKGTWESQMTVVSEISPWGPRGSVETLSHIAKPQLTWIVGAGVAYDGFTVRYVYMNTPSKNVSDANVPLGYKAAHMLTVGYRF